MFKEATLYGIPAKWWSLVALVVQNSSFVLLLRYSRTQPGLPYIPSSSVIVSEVVKFFVSIALYLREKRHDAAKDLDYLPAVQTPQVKVQAALHTFLADNFSLQSGILKMGAPALLYTLQNTLQIVAATHLEAAVFQISYQGKLLTTALFSVLILRTKLSQQKWLALVFLFIGVALAAIGASRQSKTDGLSGSTFTIGVSAEIAACTLSGLASIVFEFLLKKYETSLWTRNIQLSCWSLLVAVVGAIIYDGKAIRQDGFFQGYNLIVVITILVQACGGIIVAVVVQYADNILKGFATSISVVLSTVASVFIFGFVVTTDFVMGSALVLLSTYQYSLPDAPKLPFIAPHDSKQRTPLDEDKDIDLDYLDEPSTLVNKDSDIERQHLRSRASSLEQTEEARVLLK